VYVFWSVTLRDALSYMCANDLWLSCLVSCRSVSFYLNLFVLFLGNFGMIPFDVETGRMRCSEEVFVRARSLCRVYLIVSRLMDLCVVSVLFEDGPWLFNFSVVNWRDVWSSGDIYRSEIVYLLPRDHPWLTCLSSLCFLHGWMRGPKVLSRLSIYFKLRCWTNFKPKLTNSI